MVSAADHQSRLKRDVEALHGGAFGVALVAAGSAMTGLAGLVVIGPLIGIALVLHLLAGRAQARERRRIRQAGLVFGSLNAVHRAPAVDDLVRELLSAARELLEADVAWMALLSRTPTGAPIVIQLGGRQAQGPVVRGLTTPERVLAGVASEGSGAVLLDATRADEPVREAMTALGVRSGIVSAFGGDGDARGVIAVGRSGATRRNFGSEGLHLVNAFAEHAGVLVENERLERSLRELTTLKEQLRHQAFHDGLTGLPNRVLFADQVAEVLGHSVAGLTAVFFLDLDDFKTINDSLGHQAGDELLVAAAQRVAGAVRPSDIAARLGGDEFAVLSRVGREEEAAEIADRLVATLDAPFVISGREISVHASVGYALGEQGSTTAPDLLRNADAAMYEAKRGGKRRFAEYAPYMHTSARRRQEMATALDRAVARDEIGVHYQPIVHLETGEVMGVEALARWKHPVQGLAYPESFLPLAEEIGLMVEIGRLVLVEAAGAASSWQRAFAGCEKLRVNVNLAPSELHDPLLLREVSSILERTGLEPESLVLEITESGVMRRPEHARRAMEELRRLGVSLALDDFGTGHSSLAHLREFPLDSLKIAREFVAGLPSGHVDRTFVETIVRMGAALGLEVIAEGIESEAQARCIASLGCAFGQGYYFGEPVGVMGVTRYLTAPRLPADPPAYAGAA